MMADRREQDRSDAIAWARSVSADRRVVYLDTETTGLKDSAEIIDIAAVTGSGAVLFNSLVKPERPIPEESSRIHGIYDDHVVAAPRWIDVVSWLETLLVDARVVVYNAGYDSSVINASCRRTGRAPMAHSWECAMLHYAAYVGEPGFRGDYRWHRLENAAAAFCIKPGGHRALEDAIACRNVVLAMAASGDRQRERLL